MSDSLKDRIVEKQMQVINKPERSSNLEFYRILVMLSIVAHHYVVNSGVTDVMKEDPMSFNSIYYYLILIDLNLINSQVLIYYEFYL